MFGSKKINKIGSEALLGVTRTAKYNNRTYIESDQGFYCTTNIKPAIINSWIDQYNSAGSDIAKITKEDIGLNGFYVSLEYKKAPQSAAKGLKPFTGGSNVQTRMRSLGNSMLIKMGYGKEHKFVDKIQKATEKYDIWVCNNSSFTLNAVKAYNGKYLTYNGYCLLKSDPSNALNAFAQGNSSSGSTSKGTSKPNPKTTPAAKKNRENSANDAVKKAGAKNAQHTSTGNGVTYTKATASDGSTVYFETTSSNDGSSSTTRKITKETYDKSIKSSSSSTGGTSGGQSGGNGKSKETADKKEPELTPEQIKAFEDARNKALEPYNEIIKNQQQNIYEWNEYARFLQDKIDNGESVNGMSTDEMKSVFSQIQANILAEQEALQKNLDAITEINYKSITSYSYYSKELAELSELTPNIAQSSADKELISNINQQINLNEKMQAEMKATALKYPLYNEDRKLRVVHTDDNGFEESNGQLSSNAEFNSTELHGDEDSDDIKNKTARLLDLKIAVPQWGIKDFILERSNFQQQFVDIGGDPGYFFFKIFFNLNTAFGLFGGRLNTQNSSLWPTIKAQNSASWYLAISQKLYGTENLPDRLIALAKMHKLLSHVCYKTPWFFKEVSGLKEASIPAIKDITKEKSIEITCNPDSTDMRLSTIMDLYRYICFDNILNKEIVPENLRKFEFSIIGYSVPIKMYQRGFNNKFNSKTFGAESPEDRLTFKMWTFKGCEFDLSSISTFDTLSNEKPNQINPKLKIKYDRCYMHTSNEWEKMTFGDLGFQTLENGYNVLDSRLKYINNSISLIDDMKGNITKTKSQTSTSYKPSSAIRKNVLNKLNSFKIGKGVNRFESNNSEDPTSWKEFEFTENLLSSAEDNKKRIDYFRRKIYALYIDYNYFELNRLDSKDEHYEHQHYQLYKSIFKENPEYHSKELKDEITLKYTDFDEFIKFFNIKYNLQHHSIKNRVGNGLLLNSSENVSNNIIEYFIEKLYKEYKSQDGNDILTLDRFADNVVSNQKQKTIFTENTDSHTQNTIKLIKSKYTDFNEYALEFFEKFSSNNFISNSNLLINEDSYKSNLEYIFTKIYNEYISYSNADTSKIKDFSQSDQNRINHLRKTLFSQSPEQHSEETKTEIAMKHLNFENFMSNIINKYSSSTFRNTNSELIKKHNHDEIIRQIIENIKNDYNNAYNYLNVHNNVNTNLKKQSTKTL